MMKASVRRICLNCEYEGATFGEADKKPKEVITCPFCLGSYVDKFHYAKYKQKLPTEKRENKAVKEAQEAKKDNPIPLLTIELEDMNSVPVVKYKGEELGHKTYVKFDWERKTDKSFGGVEFDIEHHVSKAKQNKVGHFNTIKKSSTFKGSLT